MFNNIAFPVAMKTIGTVFAGAGNFMAGSAARATGEAQKAEAEFEAQQLEQQGGQVFAASQRTAMEKVRQGKLVESRALALAAASGGGTGAGVMNLIADLHADAAYRSAVALYEGEDKQRQMMMAAGAKRYEGALAEKAGKSKQLAYNIAGVSAIFKGGSTLYDSYGGGGPQQAPAPVESRTLSNSGINWDLT